MKKIKSVRKLCFLCMEEHDVDIVEIMDNEIYKNKEMIKNNSMSMKDAYLKSIK